MDFSQARSEYLHLRHAYRSGQISPEEFEKQVNSMIVHSNGQTWMIGVKTGKWYRREGKAWKEDVPQIEPKYGATSSSQQGTKNIWQAFIQKIKSLFERKPAETKQEKSFRQMTLGFSAVFVILLVAVVVMAVLMFKGVIGTPGQLSNLFSTSSDTDGIGIADSSEGSTTLAANLTIPENGVITISGNPSLAGYLYTADIIGTWTLTGKIDETIEFDDKGNVRIFSEKQGYDHSGTYSFSGDHDIRFETDAGSVQTIIWIDENILTLAIDDIILVYNPAE